MNDGHRKSDLISNEQVRFAPEPHFIAEKPFNMRLKENKKHYLKEKSKQTSKMI